MSPTLLSLPRELRFHIYSYLTSPEPISYPFAHSPITSISHRPPPSSLQRTCCALHLEIQSYFYTLATVRLIPRTFAPTYYAQSSNAASLQVLRLARKVEVVLIWDSEGWRANWRQEHWRSQWMHLLQDTIRLLTGQGKSLHTVVVSARDGCDVEVRWDAMKSMLKPLEEMEGRVKLVVGEVVAAEGMEEELRMCLGRYIMEFNGIEA